MSKKEKNTVKVPFLEGTLACLVLRKVKEGEKKLRVKNNQSIISKKGEKVKYVSVTRVVVKEKRYMSQKKEVCWFPSLSFFFDNL
jgi:hypothetical protein